MTEEKLKEIEARAMKASVGPWMRNGKTVAGWRIDDADPNRVGLVFMMSPTAFVPGDDNATFIAEAREDVPCLIEEIRRLKSELIKAHEPVDNPGQIQ